MGHSRDFLRFLFKYRSLADFQGITSVCYKITSHSATVKFPVFFSPVYTTILLAPYLFEFGPGA